MTLRGRIAAVLGALLIGLAAAREEHYVLHETRPFSGIEWIKERRASPDEIVPVRIGLTQRNLDIGPDMLHEISDPESPRYGQHYSYEQVVDLFAPSDETVSAVRTWLELLGIPRHEISQSTNKQWLQFDARIDKLEQALKTEFYLHRHVDSGKFHPACDKYYVPETIQQHIDYVTPGVKLPQMFSSKSTNVNIDGGESKKRLPIKRKPLPQPLPDILAAPLHKRCNKAITPACIRTLYNFTIGTTAYPGNQIGIFESLNEYYRQEDFDIFFTHLFPQIPNGTHPKPAAIDGGHQYPYEPPDQDGLESQLDFDLAMPIVYPQTAVVYQSGDRYSEVEYLGIFNIFLDAIDGSYCTYCAYGECGDLKGFDPPFPDHHKGGYKGKLQCGKFNATNVISISYGASEFYTPLNYQRRMCNEFMKLGMQGISVVVASGDSGFASSHPALDNGCLFAHKDNNYFMESFDKTVANPDTPQVCPWVTVVGATLLPPGANVHKDQEVTTNDFPSGAGFSNIFRMPKYQKAAVAEYFTRYTPPFKSYQSVLNDSFAAGGGLYNSIGRAYPDVSANGENMLISVANNFSLNGGTSASAPIFASLLTRINEQRLLAKKSTIGFVNPVLYKHPTVLHDLTNGTDRGCVKIVFNATKGWDPVFGLGTPNFPAMVDLFLSLP